MSRRSSSRDSRSQEYQLPHMDRVCGRLAEGQPCPLGPDGHGECRVESLCSPWYDGTQWHCTRAAAFGGRCSEGPVPDPQNPEQSASCPHQLPPCQPVRSLRSRRRVISGVTAAGTLGLCLIILGGSSGDGSHSPTSTTAIISPGPLSAHHATMNEGCSACHSAATQSPVDFLSCVFGGAGGIDESHKCLKCHEDLGEHALQPHSLSPARLAALPQHSDGSRHTTQQMLSRLLVGHQTTESGQLACATCHQEHRGADFDLTSMTNAQCQSCHSSTFHSLADGHPDFDERPRARLHFDHLTHLNLHFQSFERLMPDGKARMQCGDCHQPDSSGHMINLESFEVMCASCHEPQIRDFDSRSDAQLHELVFFDADARHTDPADVSPFMQLMLDEKAGDPVAVRELLTDLADDGEETLRRRLHLVCDQSTESSVIEACVQALEESHFFDAMTVVGNEQNTGTETGPQDVIYGNWRFDPEHQTLVYDCTVHADPVLRAWIDLLAHNTRRYPEPPAPDSTGVFDRFFRDLAAPGSTGRCLKCHSTEQSSASGLLVHWSSAHGHRSQRGFTRFSHRPHLTLLSSEEEVNAVGGTRRCEACHALNGDSFDLVSPAYQLSDGLPNPHRQACSALGVLPVHRQNCAQCHTQTLAGDNCLQCHNYHVHEDSF